MARTWALFYLAFRVGLDTQTIAEILGMTPGSVAVKLVTERAKADKFFSNDPTKALGGQPDYRLAVNPIADFGAGGASGFFNDSRNSAPGASSRTFL
jgi:hypothetical protein